ncbi:MAG TPA: XRE family transcriptional regulator [Pseudomonadales bacterium]|nr:XRE family transcriptional regulator [Pseudomonadales bacterium]
MKTVSSKTKAIAGHVTAAGRSALEDLFAPEEAAELEIRAGLLRGLQAWLAESAQTQTAAAQTLKISQARVSDIKHGKISQFSLDKLVRLAARAGLHPRLELNAA